MKRLENTTEKDELLTRLSYDLAALTDTGIAALPPSTQGIIAQALASGQGQLAVVCVLTPWPVLIGTLMLGPEKDPIELFRVTPSNSLLRTKDTPTH